MSDPLASPRCVSRGADMRQTVVAARSRGRRIGLIPTMGALHDGHLSLVKAAKAECEEAIVTIFVNPTQFGPQEDFGRYPRTLEADLAKLKEVGADWVFTPSADEMYPAGFSTYVSPPAVAEPLEGRLRPGHFRGVCTVVLKLFQLAPADVAYFGQKDYQQSLVVRRMTADLNLPIQVRVQPTIREPDGLAMSSRNAYLSSEERSQALSISRGLRACARQFEQGERSAAMLIRTIAEALRAARITEIDYIAIADPRTLADRDPASSGDVALVAARVGKTRLIDNMLLE